jgi:hypothetical protein
MQKLKGISLKGFAAVANLTRSIARAPHPIKRRGGMSDSHLIEHVPLCRFTFESGLTELLVTAATLKNVFVLRVPSNPVHNAFSATRAFEKIRISLFCLSSPPPPPTCWPRAAPTRASHSYALFLENGAQSRTAKLYRALGGCSRMLLQEC